MLVASHPHLQALQNGHTAQPSDGVALTTVPIRDTADAGVLSDTLAASAPSSAPSAALPKSSTRPIHSHRRTTSSTSVYGHRKHNSVSVSSVFGASANAGASFESATGVDMVKHLDWVEREEKRRRNVLGRQPSWQQQQVEEENEDEVSAVEEEDEDEDVDDVDASGSITSAAEPWGVRSESDVLQHTRPLYSPLFGVIESSSGEQTNAVSTSQQRSTTRQRSGSLTHIQTGPPPASSSSFGLGRASLDHGRGTSSLSTRPGQGTRPRLSYDVASRYSADGGARRQSGSHASWLDVLDRDDDDKPGDATEPRRKVVIVEVSSWV